MPAPYDPWECRPDLAYDEYAPSTLLHPNGSLVCSLDRTFLGVATRLVMYAWDEAR